ncbi:excalibur calcium-binding domain-containing protein [Frankia sp. R43]
MCRHLREVRVRTWRPGETLLHAGEPGYRGGLDRDGDGAACDKK